VATLGAGGGSSGGVEPVRPKPPPPGDVGPVEELRLAVVAFKDQLATGVFKEDTQLLAAVLGLSRMIAPAVGLKTEAADKLKDEHGKPTTATDPVALHGDILELGEHVGFWKPMRMPDGEPVWIDVLYLPWARVVVTKALREIGQHSVARMLAQKNPRPEPYATRDVVVARRQRRRQAEGKSLGRGPSADVTARVNSLVTRCSAGCPPELVQDKRGAARELLADHMQVYGGSLARAREDWRKARKILVEKGVFPGIS
jgi:hypothetical protein